MSDEGGDDETPPDDRQGGDKGEDGQQQDDQQKNQQQGDGNLHLRLRAGRDADINIGIDSQPPEKKEGEGGKDDKGGDDKSGDDKEKGGDKDGKDKKDDKDGKDGDKKKQSPLKKTWVRVLLVVVVVLLLVAFGIWLYHWWTWGRFQQSTNDAYLKVDQITVSPQTAGYVTQVLVDDNQMVRAGQVLVKIDPLPYQAKLDQAKAQIDAAHADVERFEAEIDRQQAQIAQAEAQLAGAKTNAAFYGSEVIRYMPLSAAGAETSEKLAQLQNSYKQAQATEASDAAQVVSAQREIASLKAQIAQAEAQGEQAAAQAKEAQIDLDYTIIRASKDGRIGDKTVRIGQYLQPGTKIMSVVPLQEIYCESNYKETQIGLMRIGQPVDVRVDALPQVKIHGVVASFSPGTGAEFSLLPPENATGNFTKIVQRVPVRIRLIVDKDTQEILVPGLSVETSVNTIGEKDFPDRAKQEYEREERQGTRHDVRKMLDTGKAAP